MPTTDSKQSYLTICRLILRQGVRWSAVDTENWLRVSNISELLDDPESLLYHEAPQCVLADALITGTLRRRITSRQRNYLRRDLKCFLAEYDFTPNTDWADFRDQWARVLAPYYSSLGSAEPVIRLVSQTPSVQNRPNHLGRMRKRLRAELIPA